MPAKLPSGRAAPLRLFRHVLPIALAAACLWAALARAGAPGWAEVWAEVSRIAPGEWIGAILTTCISFWAIGRYDALAHRHFGTGLPERAARTAGMLSIAFSQMVGFGLFTGTLARWRLTPGLSPVMAFRITLFVSVSFIAALGFVAGVACFLAPPIPFARTVAILGPLGCLAFLALAFFRPTLTVAGRRFRLPTLPAFAKCMAWAMIDTLAAAGTLWILMPDGAQVPWDVLCPAYLVALGAALVSGTPGGVGPFELVLLTLLPGSDAEAVLGAILAFRLIYFVAPSLVAGAFLVSNRRRMGLPRDKRRPTLILAGDVPDRPLRAEHGVLAQSEARMLRAHGAELACLELPQATIGFLDPLRGTAHAAAAILSAHAHRNNRVAAFYRCSQRWAARLRSQGWHVIRTAREAVLDPRDWSADRPVHRQLRRKLRNAERAGVTVARAGVDLPLSEMAKVDAAWVAEHGRAFGTTMGRFSAGYVAGQEIFLAWRDGHLVAYATFHTAPEDWCLDLMRAAPDTPDGTMHALVVAGLAQARAVRAARVSLASVPDLPRGRFAAAGLRQFKDSFAPVWEPRYLAAPDRVQLALAAADLVRAVHRPPDLRGEGYGPANSTHGHDEENAIALSIGS